MACTASPLSASPVMVPEEDMRLAQFIHYKATLGGIHRLTNLLFSSETRKKHCQTHFSIL